MASDDTLKALASRIDTLEQQLAREQSQADATPAPEAYRELQNLKALQETLAPTKKKPDRSLQFALVALTAGAVAIISFLPATLFTPISVEAEIHARRVSLQMGELPQQLGTPATPAIASKRLQLSLEGQPGPGPAARLQTLLQEEVDAGGTLIAFASGKASATLDLPAVSAGSTWRLETLPGQRFRIEVEQGSEPLGYQLTLPESTSLILESIGESFRTYSLQSLSFTGASAMETEFQLRASAPPIFSTSVPLQGIQFSTAGSSAAPVPVSSIRSGSIGLSDLGTRLDLFEHQALNLHMRSGVLRSVALEDNGDLRLRFGAQVSRLAVDGRTAVPTVLEYLSASEYFNLVWSSILACVGGVMFAARWKGLLKN